MRYGLFPGCVLEGASKEDYMATLAVAKKLGIELVELPGWTCCGASHVQDIDPELVMCTNARNIALAEQMKLDVMTVCNTCTLMLRKAKHTIDTSAENKEFVNDILSAANMEYKGTSEVTHFLWILLREIGIDKLKEKVVKPLTGIKIGEFYGCHILRPESVMGFEDFMDPDSLQKVIEAVGATPINFSRQRDCCGFHAVYPAHDSVMQMTGSINKDAADEGADCLVTPCPLCHMQLDMFQKEARTTVPNDVKMPILHLTQLIGLALGCDPRELGLTVRHLTSTKQLLEKIQ